MSHLTPTPRHFTPCDDDDEQSKRTRLPIWKSRMRKGKRVTFPEFTGERVYMQPFLKTHGEILLPAKLARWLPTIEAMLDDIETRSPMYLMIDQAEVPAGVPQRRPGPHIDGSWSETGIGVFNPNELLILASDVIGCAVYLGDYKAGGFGEGGDCSAIDLSGLTRMPLAVGFAWIGNALTIHESIPVKSACKRTLVRINAPIT
jgi:hypothetical protein